VVTSIRAILDRVALFETLFDGFNRAGLRYVVVGGVAVVLHGFARLTADVDIVVDLSPEEAAKAVGCLSSLGLRPRAPVDPIGFATPAIRQTWIQRKGMQVFSWYDPKNPMREVDVFVSHPIPFEDLWARSILFPLGALLVRVASIADLVQLKRLAGRPQDLTDIEALEEIERRRPRKP
jgi:hypothetical protein